MRPFRAFLRQHSTIISLAAIALGVLIFVGRWFIAAPTAASETATDAAVFSDTFSTVDAVPTAAPAPTEAPPIVVYISGAVRSPDVYQLPAAARVKDLVLAAGGLAADADAEHINLAEHIRDGQHIHVPRQGEALPAGANSSAVDASSNTDGIIDLNAASAADLDELDGIGQVLAQRIIEYRTTHGPFKSVDDLSNVKGISATLLSKIAPQLRIGA